jgi:hypothetical protein
VFEDWRKEFGIVGKIGFAGAILMIVFILVFMRP